MIIPNPYIIPPETYRHAIILVEWLVIFTLVLFALYSGDDKKK